MGLGIENKVSSVFSEAFPPYYDPKFSQIQTAPNQWWKFVIFFLICFVCNSKYGRKNTHYKYP